MRSIFFKRLSFIIFSLACMAVSVMVQSTQAADLLHVYFDGLHNDPTLKQEKFTMQAREEAAPQARALLLPQISGQASLLRQHTDQRGDSSDLVAAGSSTTRDIGNTSRIERYNLNLTQILFDFTKFKNIDADVAFAHQAEALYAEGYQDLIQRVATAYFSILEAEDLLRFDNANKLALKRQLDESTEQYKVGIKTIKDVYEVRASYDASVATLIADEKSLADKREDLLAITGVQYQSVEPLGDNPPLISPRPKDINAWVQIATQHNLALLADRFDVLSKNHLIAANFGGHLPNLSLDGQIGASKFSSSSPGASSEKNQSLALQLNFPIFSGGAVSSQVREAQNAYLAAVSKLEFDYRAVITQTRKDFLGVVSSISKIQADDQAVRSSRSALNAARAEFQVGTATMLDVLTQQSNLLQSQSQYTQDLYRYINDTIALKRDTGTLTIGDLSKINHWLVPSESKVYPDAFISTKEIPIDKNNNGSVPHPSANDKSRSNTTPSPPHATTPKNSFAKSITSAIPAEKHVQLASQLGLFQNKFREKFHEKIYEKICSRSAVSPRSFNA